ncbi:MULTISPECIES: hypothetical protein [Cyanophyceae]|uniref:hypothetical protein n=1 Tax=Cyanophyceae TaxID=3028117 RepID=UPI00016DCE38|nr:MULTISPECIES: hypothetical protein [Cyanophyceae]ACB00905.1 hypothetical protein SYNPCC7002_E0013 [Picosynechococcus sp. PCC 7002]SMH57959.1 hypothetical protein SAMN06272755_3104 [Picosynechococcus sp. OG1]SMQ86487.1 hypothetical protein SAMN06272774_3236 [Synechococcus sp. 7002]
MNNNDILQSLINHDSKITLSLDAFEVFVLVAYLQTAQHWIRGENGLVVRGLVEKLIAAISRSIPEAGKLLEQGNQPGVKITEEYFE